MGWLALAAGVVKGLSAYNAGVYQSQVAQNNATIARYNTSLALEKGQQEAQIAGLQQGKVLGEQRAAAAASGVEADFGSPLRLQADTTAAGRQDQLSIVNNAALEAWGYNSKARDFQAEQGNARFEAVQNAFGSFIGGAADASNKWSAQKTGG